MARIHVVLPLYRDNDLAHDAFRRVVASVSSDLAMRCTILDKTEGAVALAWMDSDEVRALDRVTVVRSSRTSNFFVDAADVPLFEDEYLLMVHDDDDWTGLSCLTAELATSAVDVLVPRLIKVLANREEAENLDWLAADLQAAGRLARFLQGARPQTFLFSAVSAQVWRGWATYVRSRPLPSLSLDFTLAVYLLLTTRPAQSPNYVYRFNMSNWTNQRTAQASTARWLAQDGWRTLTAEDVWLIRLLDDVSLLGYLSNQMPRAELELALASVVRAQDGLTHGRFRLGWASGWLTPRIRWTVVAAQGLPDRIRRGDFRRAGIREQTRWGHVHPRLDPRPDRILPSLSASLLPALAATCQGAEREQVDYWAHWVSVLQARIAHDGRAH